GVRRRPTGPVRHNPRPLVSDTPAERLRDPVQRLPGQVVTARHVPHQLGPTVRLDLDPRRLVRQSQFVLVDPVSQQRQAGWLVTGAHHWAGYPFGVGGPRLSLWRWWLGAARLSSCEVGPARPAGGARVALGRRRGRGASTRSDCP